MSHQNRRDPLPSDYQFPTHGVDCDCPPCRNKVTAAERAFWKETDEILQRGLARIAATKTTQTAYGWGV